MTIDDHDQLIGRLLSELERGPHVVGVMLQGSVARRDHSPGSDLDLLVLTQSGNLPSGHTPTFRAEEIGTIWVEQHFQDAPGVKERLTVQPMLAYGLLDGSILYDPQGELAALVQYAESVLATYTTSQQVIEDLRYWLASTKRKLEANQRSGGRLKSGFIVATNSWKILEALWAVNGLPIPPSGAVLARIHRLPERPDQLESELGRLFLGTAEQRSESAASLIDWVLGRLPNPA